MSTPDTESRLDERIVERFGLKAFVEACLVLEEGIAGVREIDLGMMLGTGMVPGPFARADARGLDEVLAALERAEQEWGEHFAPPLMLRRLVAQGRLGLATGQGFYPYPQPEPGYEQALVKLDRRSDDVAVLWLDNPPANSLSPDVVEAFERAWGEVDGQVAAVVIASPNPALFCAGADIKAFTRMDAEAGRDQLARVHAFGRAMERSRTLTIAAVNGTALGGGSELALASDLVIAEERAKFGLPEVKRGLIAAAGGVFRIVDHLPRKVAMELIFTGEPMTSADALKWGLINQVVPDGTAVDAALALAERITCNAPLAVWASKRVAMGVDDGVIVGDERGWTRTMREIGTLIRSEDAKEGPLAFAEKRQPVWKAK